MNKIIIADNKYCKLVTEEDKTLNLVRKFLSYRETGVEYSGAYKNGWNGITFLMNKKGVFYLGLLDKTTQFLNENNIPFTIEDKRKINQTQDSIDLSKKLNELKLIPRDYQERIVNCATKNSKGIVRACTGSGKTLCTALITAKINKPTIIYVIGLDLLQQFHDLFSSLFDEPIGFIGNGTCKIERINIASIWTVGRALHINDKDLYVDEDNEFREEFNESQEEKIVKLLEQAKVHIFDESHIITCSTIQSIHKKIDPEHIYGFSGTPFRDDNTDLLIHGLLGEQIVDVSASELIDKNILAQPIIKFVSVPNIPMTTAPYQTVYKEYIVENEVRNNLIVQQVQGLLAKKYTPLVLFKQIKHGNVLFEKMEDAGIKCAMLYGNDSLARRNEVKDMLNKKEIDVILASTIFDIGVDLPILNALVLCGGGKSSIRALQRIGRVIRAYPGKKYAAIVDFYDQTKFLKKHSMMRYRIYCGEKGFKVIKSKEMG